MFRANDQHRQLLLPQYTPTTTLYQLQVYDTIAATDRSFGFNVIFEPEARQEDVFEHSGVKRLIDMALDG